MFTYFANIESIFPWFFVNSYPPSAYKIDNRPNKKTLPTTKDDQKKSRPVEEGPPTTLHRPDAKFDHRHDKDDDKEEIMAEDNNPPEETDLDYVLIEMMDEAVGPPSR